MRAGVAVKAPVRPVTGLGHESDGMIETVHGELFPEDEVAREVETVWRKE